MQQLGSVWLEMVWNQPKTTQVWLKTASSAQNGSDSAHNRLRPISKRLGIYSKWLKIGSLDSLGSARLWTDLVIFCHVQSQEKLVFSPAAACFPSRKDLGGVMLLRLLFSRTLVGLAQIWEILPCITSSAAIYFTSCRDAWTVLSKSGPLHDRFAGNAPSGVMPYKRSLLSTTTHHCDHSWFLLSRWDLTF